jgi:hypothetical protein
MWPHIEKAISQTERPCRVDHEARTTIQREVAKQGYTLEHLAAYLEARGLGSGLNNRCLALLKFAPRFAEALAEGNNGRYEDRILDRDEMKKERATQTFRRLMKADLERMANPPKEQKKQVCDTCFGRKLCPPCITCAGSGR